MSQLTQRAIVETTLRLVDRKPLNKITVRDIVEACGITRNTFYYHFHDIYEVLEHALSFEFERLGESSEEAGVEPLISALHFCITYKNVLFNLYRSIGYEELAQYVKKQLHKLLQKRICRAIGERKIEERDLELICMLFEEAITGALMRVITDPKKEFDEERLMTAIERLKVLFHGELTRVLQQGESNPLAGGKNE